MTREKNQTLLFSDADILLIKNTFGGEMGEDNLYLIRDALLQFPMDESKKKRLKALMTADLYRILRKRLLPQVDKDSIMGNCGDLLQLLTNDLKVKDVDQMDVHFFAKQIEIDYLNQQFDHLMDVEREIEPKLKLSDMAVLGNNSYQNFANTTARNFIIGYVDGSLILIKNIAGQKDETVEQAK